MWLEIVLGLVNVDVLLLPSCWGDGEHVEAHSDLINHVCCLPSGAGVCLRAWGMCSGWKAHLPRACGWCAGLCQVLFAVSWLCSWHLERGRCCQVLG